MRRYGATCIHFLVTAFVVLLALGVFGAPGLRAASDYLSPPWRVDTFAGYTGVGGADGPAASATFNEPSGLALGPAGRLYIADTRNSAIRVLDAGAVTTLTGQAGVDGFRDGALAVAKFNLPFGLAATADGVIFVADTDSHRIRTINTNTGMVGTLAGFVGQPGAVDATGVNARFRYPTAVAHHAATGVLYVADTFNHTIRRIDIATGAVTTLAGKAGEPGATLNGVGTLARFNEPIALALSADGALLYVADQAGHVIRQVVTATGTVTTLSGLAGTSGGADGTAGIARFDEPKGLALDGAGYLYVSDSNGCRIRRVVVATGEVETLAGGYRLPASVDGVGSAARFNQPAGLAYDAANNRLLVADALNAQIRALNLSTRAVTTLAGVALSEGAIDGVGEEARFSAPHHLARDAAGNLYIADRDNHTLRKISPGGVVTTLAGLAGAAGTVDGTGAAARFNQPVGVAVKADGSLIYVSEEAGHVVRQVTAAGVVTTLAGSAGAQGFADGTGAAARFTTPAGLALDAAGNLYVADFGNHTIRRVTPAGVVTTFAGTAGLLGATDGAGASALFRGPYGVAVDAGGAVYVADSLNHTIRKITPAGVATTLAGLALDLGDDDAATGAEARFRFPYGVAVDASGRVYVAEFLNHTIRRIEPSGAVFTVAGTAARSGGNDGIANSVRFFKPRGVAVAPDGQTLYIADTDNNAIRVAYPAPVPEITSALVASGTVGQPFSAYTITGTLLPNYFNAVNLPAGLNINPTTGAITGTPLFAGVYSVTLQAENVGGVGSALATITIAKANATIALSNLEQPFDGTPKAPSYTTFPQGLNVVFTYNGSATTPTAFGTYTLVATINNPDYQGEQATVFRIVEPTGWSVATVGGFDELLQSPTAVSFDSEGSLYVADIGANVIWKRTPAGVVSQFVGVGAGLDEPSGLAFDAADNLYIADTGNHVIRRVTPAGTVSVLAGAVGEFDPFDGTGTEARFFRPAGLALSPGGELFVADSANDSVRRINLTTTQVTTFSGAFTSVSGLDFASDGTLYVAASGLDSVWSVTPDETADSIAGSAQSGSSDGIGTNAAFFQPRGLAIAADGNIYVADTFNHTLRRVTPAGEVSTVAGLAGDPGSTNGAGPTARFSGPSGLAFGPGGKLYIADTDNGLIRVATPPATVPMFNSPPVVTLTEGAAPSGYFFSATGSPTTYAAIGLPPGLSLNATTGALTGTPTASGVYTVTLSVTNELTTTVAEVELTINAPAWETWREQTFSPAQLADLGVSAPGADPDGDGVPNLLEYLQDADPLSPADVRGPQMTHDAGRLGLVYEHLRAAPGWRIVPEYSVDLATWHRGPAYVEIVETTVLDARRQRVNVRLAPALAAQPKGFLRLQIEPSP